VHIEGILLAGAQFAVKSGKVYDQRKHLRFDNLFSISFKLLPYFSKGGM